MLDLARASPSTDQSRATETGSRILWSSFSTFRILGGDKPSTGTGIHYVFYADEAEPLDLYPADLLQPCSGTIKLAA